MCVRARMHVRARACADFLMGGRGQSGRGEEKGGE